jgi:hypothetical protein
MRSLLLRSLHIGIALGALSVVARAGVGLISLGAGAAAVQACSVTSTDGGVLLKSQTKYTAAAPVTATSTGTFNGEQIRIANQNGDVIVKGDPNATGISLSTVPFAFADNQDDGSAAIADVQTTIKIDQSQPGVITVSCASAVSNHGSAQNGNTGCDAFTVTVPAGTAQSPLKITAHALNGSLQATGLNMSDSAVGELHSDNGSVTVSVNGSVKADSANGDVVATVVPNKGSSVDAETSNGNVTLSLPADFSCDRLLLSAAGPGASVNIDPGFTYPFTATSTSVGTAGTGASSIQALTQNGSVELKPQ